MFLLNARNNMDTAQHYAVVISWSEDDQAFLADVPDLPGCIADGSTQAEALANAAVIIENGWKPLAN
jgi:predicted RNase H-like HicB family nuclease